MNETMNFRKLSPRTSRTSRSNDSPEEVRVVASRNSSRLGRFLDAGFFWHSRKSKAMFKRASQQIAVHFYVTLKLLLSVINRMFLSMMGDTLIE